MALVVLTVLYFVGPRLYRGGSRTLDPAVLELIIRALYKDTLVGSGQYGVFGKPLGWSSVLARFTRFLLPYFLPCLSKRTRIIVPRDVSWYAVPRIAGIVGSHFSS